MTTFSLLYIYWQVSETAFTIGSFAVRWYPLCWMMGLFLGYLLMRHLYIKQQIGQEKFEPLFVYIFVGVLVGARLGHCLFYEPAYFLSSIDHFIEMLLPIRHLSDGSWKFIGYRGLASHGGVFGMFIAIWLYCRRIGVPVMVVLDNMGICSPITAAFIRLGNLMNSEIIGRTTDVPWAFIFANVDSQPRHPGQLYESIAYVIFFIVIFLIYRHYGVKTSGNGLYFGLCLTLIFTFRFVIEYVKEVQEDFEEALPFDMGQMLSLPLIIIGVWAMLQGVKRIDNMKKKNTNIR